MEEALGKPSDKTILVVDDDENVRGLIEMSVMSEGFNVVTAVDGNDAIRMMASKRPDLIVTDVMMPGLGGYEFLRSLQGDGGDRLPIFVISASNLDKTTIDMIRQEANVIEFIPKPVPLAAFAASLHKVLKTMPKEIQRSRGLNDRPW
jgi:CheY-like chemotaxis protein